MTEEIIISKKDSVACNYWKACDYYKQLKRLEQENKELKEKITSLESEIRQKKMTIMMNNDHYLTVDENNRNYRSALEEIRGIAAPRFVNGLNEESDLCNLAMDRIQNIINEVLK